MDAITAYNKQYEFFKDITGEAMRVHRKYHPGLLESAYEAALKYLLEQKGYKVERQKFLPIFWDDVKLDQDYRMDLVVNDNIIIELKAITVVELHESDAPALWYADKLQPRRTLQRVV